MPISSTTASSPFIIENILGQQRGYDRVKGLRVYGFTGLGFGVVSLGFRVRELL